MRVWHKPGSTPLSPLVSENLACIFSFTNFSKWFVRGKHLKLVRCQTNFVFRYFRVKLRVQVSISSGFWTNQMDTDNLVTSILYYSASCLGKHISVPIYNVYRFELNFLSSINCDLVVAALPIAKQCRCLSNFDAYIWRDDLKRVLELNLPSNFVCR